MPLGIERDRVGDLPRLEQLAVEDRLAFDDRGAGSAAFEVFELRDGAGRNSVLGPFLQRQHAGVDRVAQIDVVDRDVDRHGLDVACLVGVAVHDLANADRGNQAAAQREREQQQRFRSHDSPLRLRRRNARSVRDANRVGGGLSNTASVVRKRSLVGFFGRINKFGSSNSPPQESRKGFCSKPCQQWWRTVCRRAESRKSSSWILVAEAVQFVTYSSMPATAK